MESKHVLKLYIYNKKWDTSFGGGAGFFSVLRTIDDDDLTSLNDRTAQTCPKAYLTNKTTAIQTHAASQQHLSQ